MADQRDPRPDDVGTATYIPDAPQCKPERYAITKFHARGGMGEVWQAVDAEIGRTVALKRLRGERGEQKARFLAEAQITGQLEHPGIVPVHDLGLGEDSRPFYVMSFVAGRTLKDVIADYFAPNTNTSEPREVQRRRLLEVFVQVCRTIAYAHSKGVVHRDIKPDNIMLGAYGETVVLDWGLAKLQGRPEEPAPAGYVHLSSSGMSTATEYGSVLGAPPYMAPEVAEGKATEADERTDVYLLGGTLYEILTGRAPRQGSSKSEIIEVARTVPPVPPRQVKPEVPPALSAICMRAMAHRRQDRYGSAAELAEDVERYLAREPVAAYPEPLPARAWRWCKRHRRALGRTATAALLLGLVVGGWILLDAAIRRYREAELAAADLRQREEARTQVERFRQLADELHFQAAKIDVGESVPYYDPATGEKLGKAALDIAEPWGPQLENLPLTEQQPALKAELDAVYLLLAQLDLQNQPAAAKQLLDRAETLGGRSRSLHRLRADAYDRLADRKKAAEQRALARDATAPATALDRFLEGEQLRLDSNKPRGKRAEELSWRPNLDPLRQAVAKYRAALELQPRHYWANYQLGRCLLGLGRSDEAVLALGACVALRPDAPWGWSTRGLAQTVGGQFAEAQRDLDKALALEPQFAPALVNRASLRWKQGQLEGALSDLDGVTIAEAAYYRGLVLLEQRKYAAALRELDSVAEALPKFWAAHLPRARACFALGKKQAGLDALDAYLAGLQRFDAQKAEACVARGALLRRLTAREPVSAMRKRLGELALEQLLEAQKRGVQSAQLYRELGAMFDPPEPAKNSAERARAQQAIKYYTDGLTIAPGHARLHLSRGAGYAQHLADYKNALSDLTQAVQVPADEPDARMIRSEAHSWLGFVHARKKDVALAQAAAALALLYGHDDDGRESYLIIHNVAGIFAELSVCDAPRVLAHQDVCLTHLERAVALWRQVGRGPDEVKLIKRDPSFRSLKELPRFQKLIVNPQK